MLSGLLVSGWTILLDVTLPQVKWGSCNIEPSSDQNEDTTKHMIKNTNSFYYPPPPLRKNKSRNKTDLA